MHAKRVVHVSEGMGGRVCVWVSMRKVSLGVCECVSVQAIMCACVHVTSTACVYCVSDCVGVRVGVCVWGGMGG